MLKILTKVSNIFLLALFVASFMACKEDSVVINDASQLNSKGMVAGAGLGSKGFMYIQERLPNAKAKVLELTEGIVELKLGKIQGYVYDDVSLEYDVAAANVQGVKIVVPDDADAVDICVGVSRVTKIADLKEKLDTFIKELSSDGSLQEIQDRWTKNPNTKVPEIPKTEPPLGTLIVGTSGIVPPFSFYKDQALAGIDVELAQRFASWMNYDIEFKIYDYNAIVVAAASGSVDCIFSLDQTPERAESIDFSNPFLQVKTAILVKDDHDSDKEVYSTLENLRGKRIGVPSGSAIEELLKGKIQDFSAVQFNSTSEMALALSRGKIEGLLLDFVVAEYMTNEFDQLAIAENVVPGKYGFAFPKNSPYLKKINEELLKLKENGVLDSISRKWTQNINEIKHSIKQDENLPNGTLVAVGEFGYLPMAFIVDGEPAGIDVDILYRIGNALGYKIELRNMSFDGVLAAVASGKADFALSGISIVPEREEVVDFSMPYYDGALTLVVRKENLPEHLSASKTESKEAFLESLKTSFEKNFIRESRWKMILSGLGVSILISVCSGLVGIALGFGVCMLRRSKNKLSRGSNIVFVKVIQGTPIVVLLMIVYYVIFGSIDIPGIIAAIIGFSINFAAYSSEMIRSGLDTVDKGQIEASYAIGFSRVQTFWKVVFPQAARNFLPSIRGEFISLLKNTSIVGYIAVVDLTKATDIIRSRTMEAFFPLIMTALIYFLVSWLFAYCLEILENRVDPKRRRKAAR